MYKMYNACFLEDIAPIFKSFKNMLDGSSRFVGARLFHNFRNVIVSKMLRFQKDMFRNDLGFLFFRNILVSPKSKIIGLGSHGHFQKSENHENKRVFCFSQNETEKLLIPNPTE